MNPTVQNTSGGSQDFGAGIIAAAALRPAYSESGMIAADNVCGLRADVRDVEADIKDAIQLSNTQRMTETLNLHNRLCDSEKAAIEAKYEGKLETKEAVEKINANTNHGFEEVTEFLVAFQKDVDEKFCELKERELEEEIETLKGEVAKASQEKQTADIIAAVTKSLETKK